MLEQSRLTYLRGFILIHAAFFFFLQFFQSPHATLRKLSLGCVNQYIVVMPSVRVLAPSSAYLYQRFSLTVRFAQAVHMSMDQYIQGLFNLAKDPSADVRKLVFTVDNYLSY